MINENQIGKPDIKAIFKTASLLKKKINVNDLQQAWKNDGFPDDIRDITYILKQHGFADKEIEKVLSNVFGKDEQGSMKPVASAAIQKISDVIKKYGIDAEIKAFMQREFGDELGINPKQGIFSRFFGKKAVPEEVRQIFTNIVQEERNDTFRLIKEYEQTHLGRHKK